MPTDEAVELAAYLAAEFPNVDEPPPPADEIDEGRATRMLRRLASVRQEQVRIQTAAAEEEARIRAWEADRLSGPASAEAWLTTALEGFARMMLERTGKLSLSLPTGRLALREAAVSIEVTDEEAFRAWCDGEGQTSLLGPPKPPEPSKQAIKAALKGALALGTVAVPDSVDERGRAAFAIITEDTAEVVPGVVARRHPSGHTFTASATADSGMEAGHDHD